MREEVGEDESVEPRGGHGENLLVYRQDGVRWLLCAAATEG